MATDSLDWQTWQVSPELEPWQLTCLQHIQKNVNEDSDVVWFMSSGTQSLRTVKCIALRRSAILASAASVNQHLRANANDRWLVAIPTYHVGGFSIPIRARFSDSEVLHLKSWSAAEFHKLVLEERVTLTSLVPTQIHDLIDAGLRCPPSLRAIVVGGGDLNRSLFAHARKLGWPVLPSYGLTETASQVATASLDSLKSSEYPSLKPLSHAEIKTVDKQIWIRASSLCFQTAVSDGTTFSLNNPLEGGWLKTQDLGEVSSEGLRFIGRQDDLVKVLGVLVSTQQVAGDLEPFAGSGVVLARPGGREGHRLVFVSESASSLNELNTGLEAYNQQAVGPNRIRQLCVVPQLPRTPLGKVKVAELKARFSLND